MRLAVIFIAQLMLVLFAMAAVVTTFVVVTRSDIESTVEIAMRNHLGVIAGNVKSIIDFTEPVTHRGAKATKIWREIGRDFDTPKAPTLESLRRMLELQALMVETMPLYAYAYQSYLFYAAGESSFPWESSSTSSSSAGGSAAYSYDGQNGTYPVPVRWGDLSCGNTSGQYHCSIMNVSTVDTVIHAPPPLNFSYDVTYDHREDPTPQSYIQAIKAMTRANEKNGIWTEAAFFYDSVPKIALPVITFSVPVHYDPWDNCIVAFSIDVALYSIGGTLSNLAIGSGGNALFLFDTQNSALIATSEPASTFPLNDLKSGTDPEEQTLWRVPDTPHSGFTTAMQKALREYYNTPAKWKQPPPGVEFSSDISGALKKANVLRFTSDGDLIAMTHIRHNTLHWIAVDLTPRSFYFARSDRSTIAVVCVGVVSVLISAVVCAAVLYAVIVPIRTISKAIDDVCRLKTSTIIHDLSKKNDGAGIPMNQVKSLPSFVRSNPSIVQSDDTDRSPPTVPGSRGPFRNATRVRSVQQCIGNDVSTMHRLKAAVKKFYSATRQTAKKNEAAAKLGAKDGEDVEELIEEMILDEEWRAHTTATMSTQQSSDGGVLSSYSPGHQSDGQMGSDVEFSHPDFHSSPRQSSNRASSPHTAAQQVSFLSGDAQYGAISARDQKAIEADEARSKDHAARRDRLLKQYEAEVEDSVPFLSELRPLHAASKKLDAAVQSFTRYVPRGVVRELIKKDQLCELVMAPRECTMLFCDLQGFTKLCEGISAEQLSPLLTLYFSRMSDLVIRHDGVIDKFIGDCIMAIWGAPKAIPHAAMRAALCALQLRAECLYDPLASAFAATTGARPVARIGLHRGRVLVGNMGCAQRMNYTVIGDAVNLAARLESLNKQFDTTIMASSAIARAVEKVVVTRRITRVSVVGKKVPTDVFELVGVRHGNSSSGLGEKIKGAIARHETNQTASSQQSSSLRGSTTRAVASTSVLPVPLPAALSPTSEAGRSPNQSLNHSRSSPHRLRRAISNLSADAFGNADVPSMNEKTSTKSTSGLLSPTEQEEPSNRAAGASPGVSLTAAPTAASAKPDEAALDMVRFVEVSVDAANDSHDDSHNGAPATADHAAMRAASRTSERGEIAQEEAVRSSVAKDVEDAAPPEICIPISPVDDDDDDETASGISSLISTDDEFLEAMELMAAQDPNVVISPDDPRAAQMQSDQELRALGSAAKYASDPPLSTSGRHRSVAEALRRRKRSAAAAAAAALGPTSAGNSMKPSVRNGDQSSMHGGVLASIESTSKAQLKALIAFARVRCLASTEEAQFAARFSTAVEQFSAGRFSACLATLGDVVAECGVGRGKERAFRLLAAECERFIANPDLEFDGVLQATEK